MIRYLIYQLFDPFFSVSVVILVFFFFLIAYLLFFSLSRLVFLYPVVVPYLYLRIYEIVVVK